MFKKSYYKKDFEKLAEGMKTAYEQRIRQLEERVDRLNVENKNLRAACAEYQSREKRVGQAIVDAEEKGSEIKELYRLNAECELRTLQMFAEKWKRLAAQMADSMPKGEGEKYAAFADHLAALLGRESTAFFSDDPPSAEEMPFDPKKRIERYVAEESDTGFNLDDVLNPKQELDLEKLCRELGLMDEE